MDPPPWLDELPLRPGPPWHQLGTRTAAAGRWLLPADDSTPGELVRKAELLRTGPDVVSACRPGDDVALAVAEAAALVAPGATTLEAAARGVPEDLCVLVRHDDGWRLDAGVVCFPSVWRIGDKVGLRLSEVHDPVPAYAEELAARVDRLLDGLRADRPVWRRNWFVHDTDELHLPEPPAPPPADAVDPPRGLWLRSEHQTLARLPSTGAVLFTIRTQQAPLAAVTSRREIAAGLATAIRSWPDALAAYRGVTRWRGPLVSWLDDVGRRAPGGAPDPAGRSPANGS